MKRIAAVFTAVFGIALASCAPSEWDGSLESLLESQPERFSAVTEDPERFRVQIIYTRIDRDDANRPSFRTFHYRVDPDEYFYPASTVKLPVAALALETLNRLDIDGLSRNTVMFTEAAADFHSEVTVDPLSPNGLPSVGEYVRQIFAVSDNNAFNRLYEFLGQAALNDALQAKGFEGARIIHRLESPLQPAQHRWTNPVRFESAGAVVYRQPDAKSETDYAASEAIPLGQAEIVDGRRVEGPKDFASKNAYPLQALHDTVKALMFPDAVPARQRFDLSGEDYRFLYRAMAEYPAEAGIGRLPDGSYYPDGYVKFFLFGGSAPEIPRNLRIFNKVGDAYGFLTDAAYVVDFDARIEFLLAATVYVNANGTFNDDDYEYDDIGLPFLSDLGTAIYELELDRPREHPPNFDRLESLWSGETATTGAH